MKDFTELALNRQSCRNYDGRTPTREALEAVVETGRLAPSACNSQPYHINIVDDSALVTKVRTAVQGKFREMNRFCDAVNAFIVISETDANLKEVVRRRVGAQHYAQLDIGMLVSYMTLKATDLGLSTCILGYFMEDLIKESLHIASDDTVRLVIAVGYASADDPLRKKVRKSVEEVVAVN